MRKHLSYANVVATLALFLALAGSSYAALKITGANVRDGSLTGRDVRDGSLTARDFKAGELRPGPPGPAGPRGAAGPPGPPGPGGPAGPAGTARGYGLIRLVTKGVITLGPSKNIVDAKLLGAIEPICIRFNFAPENVLVTRANFGVDGFLAARIDTPACPGATSVEVRSTKESTIVPGAIDTIPADIYVLAN